MSELSEGSDDKEDMSTDDKISAYESLLMDCKEAIEVITNIKDSSNLKKIDFLTNKDLPKFPTNFLNIGTKERFTRGFNIICAQPRKEALVIKCE